MPIFFEYLFGFSAVAIVYLLLKTAIGQKNLDNAGIEAKRAYSEALRKQIESLENKK